MIDFTQFIIALVVLALTVMLAFIGFQIGKVLQEFRKTIEKMNKVLDDTGTVSESISKPINLISSILQKKINFKL